MEFTISTKTGIRELTNESWNRALANCVEFIAQDSAGLVESHGQETAEKVGQAVVSRMIGQTVSEAKGQALSYFDSRFREILAGDSRFREILAESDD